MTVAHDVKASLLMRADKAYVLERDGAELDLPDTFYVVGEKVCVCVFVHMRTRSY